MASGQLAPLEGTPSQTSPTTYIVVFKDNLSKEVVSEAFDEIGRILSASGGEMKHKYDIGPKFQGFSAVMNETARDQIRALDFVKYVEYDQEATIQDGGNVGVGTGVV